MNYFNPYYLYPYTTIPNQMARAGLFTRLFGTNLSFSSILNGASRVLNLTHQAIPLVKQAGPVIKNAKTMFKVMSEFNRPEKQPTVNVTRQTKTEQNYPQEVKKAPTSSLTFFQ